MLGPTSTCAINTAEGNKGYLFILFIYEIVKYWQFPSCTLLDLFITEI